MPKLWRYADDHGHFIRRFLHAGRRVMTYQVAPEGVAFLEAAGVNVRARSVDIPPGLVDALNERGFLYTGHSGLGNGDADELLRLLELDVPTSHLTHQAGASLALDLAGLPRAPELVFRHGDPWSLEIAVGPLPPTALPEGGVSSWTLALASCEVAIAGRETASSGLELWPGGAGMCLPAPPRFDEYRLELRGSWTDEMRAQVPLRALSGLAASGSLFEDDELGGCRLRPGDRLALGGRYVLLLPGATTGSGQSPCAGAVHPARSGDAAQRPVSEIPPDVVVRDLGSRDGWHALSLLLPARQSSVLLREWAHRLGHPLRAQPHRLELVAPVPGGYTAQGQPMIPGGRPVLLRVTPPDNDEWLPANATLRAIRADGTSVALVALPEGTRRLAGRRPQNRGGWGSSAGAVAEYLVFAAPAAGEYRIAGDTGWTNVLQLVVTPPVGADADTALPTWLGPAGLRLRIGEFEWDAFETAQPEAAQVVRLPLPNTVRRETAAGAGDRALSGIPQIAVDSPAVRLSLSASYDGVVVDRRVVPQAEAPLILRQWLGGGMGARRIELRVDAGAGFGSVSMVVTWDRPVRPTAHHSVRTRMQTWMQFALPRLAAQAANLPVIAPALSSPNHRGIPMPASLTPLVRHVARHHPPNGPTGPDHHEPQQAVRRGSAGPGSRQ